jgi:hypothetical protein
MQLASGENVLLDRVDKRAQQIARGTYPSGQSGA